MKKLLTLIFVLLVACASARMQSDTPFDPGALRIDGSKEGVSLTLSGKVKAAWAEITGNVYASGTLRVDGTSSFGGNVLIATSTDDGANKLQVDGFTKLGDAATGLKCKVLTGTTGAAQDDAVTVAHGLTGSKIISFTTTVAYQADSGIPEGFTDFVGYEYSTYYDATNFYVANKAATSANILNKPFTILIWYKE